MEADLGTVAEAEAKLQVPGARPSAALFWLVAHRLRFLGNFAIRTRRSQQPGRLTWH